MYSLATIKTSVLTVVQKQSLEMFYRAFSDKNPSLQGRSRDLRLARYSSRTRSSFWFQGYEAAHVDVFYCVPRLADDY